MKYILYARKSTEEDDRQVLSIEAQLVELQEYAAKEKLEIVASFQEAKTAKEPGRIKFAEMLAILESGKANGIISWHPDRARQDAQGEVSVLKEQLGQVEAKFHKLLDVYLADALSTEEYAAKKQSLLSQKVALAEKITDFEQKGVSWLEPAREFVKSLNQAANLLSSLNPSGMTTFLKNIGSNRILRNREFVFTPEIEYKLVAERSEANLSNQTCNFLCGAHQGIELERNSPKYPRD